MPLLVVSSSPVRAKPASSPRWTPISLTLVTTASPSATCSSMAKAVVEKPSRISATERLKSSRVGPCPGIRLRSTKSGLSSSSMTSRFPLSGSSKKRRTRALFSSADTELPPPCQLAFLYRVANMNMMPPGGVRRIDQRLTEAVKIRNRLEIEIARNCSWARKVLGLRSLLATARYRGTLLANAAGDLSLSFRVTLKLQHMGLTIPEPHHYSG